MEEELDVGFPCDTATVHIHPLSLMLELVTELLYALTYSLSVKEIHLSLWCGVLHISH